MSATTATKWDDIKHIGAYRIETTNVSLASASKTIGGTVAPFAVMKEYPMKMLVSGSAPSASAKGKLIIPATRTYRVVANFMNLFSGLATATYTLYVNGTSVHVVTCKGSEINQGNMANITYVADLTAGDVLHFTHECTGGDNSSSLQTGSTVTIESL